MHIVTEFGFLRRGTLRYLLAGVFVLQAVVVLVVIASEWASRRANQAQMTFNLNPNGWWRENIATPTFRPPILEAAAATLRPEEIVFGVEVGGKARAYRLAAFDDPSGHLVNDLIGVVPVSVAYCNISRCVRAYTDPRGTQPLDAEVRGLFNRQMVIRLGGNVYFHTSGNPVEPAENPTPIPYQRLEPMVTTWKEWTRLHPGTDVFAGGR